MICQHKFAGRYDTRTISGPSYRAKAYYQVQPEIKMRCPAGMVIKSGSITGTCCSRTCEAFATDCNCVSCDRGDIRPQPDGVQVYVDDAREFRPLPAPDVPRREVIDELYAAIVDGVVPVHSGAWGRATLEVCRAVIQSAKEGREVRLNHQVVVGGDM